MPHYSAPVADTMFVLQHVLHLENYANLPGFADAQPEMVGAVLEQGAKFVEEVLQPLNLSGDQEGCTRHADGSVSTPTGFKDAYRHYVDGGWSTLSQPADYGGQGLPHVVGAALFEFITSANMGFSMYPGLGQGAISSILVRGSKEQKATYLPKLVSGEWLGTMNLTEPHCGTDLSLIRTKAEPQADGTYQLTGTKIFISGGDNDLSENIIHLVLAKVTGAPDSVKGISLFIVPKFIVNADGTLGARNAVSCGSIEHKMGIRSSATCVMNYDGATGYLVGEREKGLQAMFIMMNAARLGVGQQGVALGEVAYQNAAAYAKDRIQGRAMSGAKDPAAKADPIIVHPDVRRMLLDARAFVEGGRAFVLWGALLVDLAHSAVTPEAREEADDLISLMTPVIKGYLTDKGYDVATACQQVLGGHGYVEEWGMSQFVRDARIAMIYEGANGIQALDLVGRKLGANGGRGIRQLFALIGDFTADNRDDSAMAPYVAPLEKSVGHLQAATMWLMQNGIANPDEAGAASYPYMQIMGLVCLGYLWAMMARAAQGQLAENPVNTKLYENKLITARYFAERHLCETGALLKKVEAGSATLMAMAASDF